jgi:NADPH:quinone reductase-like Zn-dependent oxidoreductase
MAIRMELDAFGGPEVLHPVEFEVPEPGEGEVLVRNVALGVNPFDWKFVSGLTTGGKPVEFPKVPGNEGAGIVEAVGAGVTEFAVGDEVIWSSYLGGFATHRLMPVARVYAKPSDIGFPEAAVLPVGGATAWSAITQIKAHEGDLVLIHAASGGVGSAGVQIALSLGARVIGTASNDNQDYVRSLGAEPVVYGEGLVERVRAMGSVTAIADFIGNKDAVAATVALLPDLSRSVTTARTPDSEAAGIPSVVADPASKPAAIALAAAGKLTPEITRTFPLAEAADALALSRSGHVRGKIVLLT